MNTKNEQNQKKNQRPKTRQEQGSKKQGQNPTMLREYPNHQDHEHPETRMTR
jgi:hypothetical protein